MVVEPASMRACVRPLTFSNMNISANSGSIVTKFHLKHYWVVEKAAICFGPDWIRTLVYMATDSSHRVIIGKILLAL